MLNPFCDRNPYRRFQRSSFLVADWVTSGIILSEVSTAGQMPKVTRSQFVPWPADLVPLDVPEQTGLWLKEICSRERLPVDAVAISVPRRDLSLKLLELPAISDDDLGPLVAFQVESRAQSTGQPVLWDFLPHPVSRNSAQRCVMLATAPAKLCEAIQRTAASAGWSHIVLTSGDLLIGNLSREDGNQWQLSVQANAAKLELLLCHNGTPFAATAVGMPSGDTESTVSEQAASAVQSLSGRMMAAAPKTWKSGSLVPAVSVNGSHGVSIAAKLEGTGIAATLRHTDACTPRAVSIADSLQQPIRNISMRSVLFSRGTGPRQTDRQGNSGSDRNTGALGPNKGFSTCRIDFLRPRSTDLRLASRRRRQMNVGILAGLLIAVCVTGIWMWHHALIQEFLALQQRQQQTQTFIERGKVVTEQWAYVSHWQRNSIQAAAEIQQLAELLPQRNRLFVTRLQLEGAADSEERMLRIDGLAQHTSDVMNLNTALVERSEHYNVRPQGIEPSPDGSVLPLQFRVEASLHARQLPITETP